MVIVDSSVLIAYLGNRDNRHTAWMRRQGRAQRIGLTTLTLTEVLQGIRKDDEFLFALRTFAAFEILETGSSALAIGSARNYRNLRKLGITIRSTIDCLIATFCIENGYELLHEDRDFDAFEQHLGLMVLHP